MNKIILASLVASIFIKQIRSAFVLMFLLYSMVMLRLSDFGYHKAIYFTYIVILAATFLSIKQKRHGIYFPYMIALVSIDVGDMKYNVFLLMLQSIATIYTRINKDGIVQAILLCSSALLCFCNVLDNTKLQSIVPVYILSISLLYGDKSSYTNKSKQVNTLLYLMYLIKFYNVCDIKQNHIEQTILTFINICTMVPLALYTFAIKNPNVIVTNAYKVLCHMIIMEFSSIGFTNILHTCHIFLAMMSMILVSSTNILNKGLISTIAFISMIFATTVINTYYISGYTIFCSAVIILQLCKLLKHVLSPKIVKTDLKILFIILAMIVIFSNAIFNGFMRLATNIGYVMVLASLSSGMSMVPDYDIEKFIHSKLNQEALENSKKWLVNRIKMYIQHVAITASFFIIVYWIYTKCKSI